MPNDPAKRPGKPAVEASDHLIFDPWQSASTGHQIADPGCTTHGVDWRNTRSTKLSQQYKHGDCIRGRGQTQLPRDATSTEPTLVPGAFNGQTQTESPPRTSGEWAWVTDDVAKRNQAGLRDIRSFMGVGKRKAADEPREVKMDKKARYIEKENQTQDQRQKVDSLKPDSESGSCTGESNLTLKAKSNIFAGVRIYINGSTLPHISDHKLKQLLTAHGANYAIYMARKTVTHVLVGQPNAVGSGAGGGLSASKLQQEIARGGWKGVKVVSVHWALESIKAGRRLAESRFPGMHVAAKGQRSVAGMFGAQAKSGQSGAKK
ncbi:hypothetical protein N7522_011039 [Penicillium canescens]|nr:hypothetical protein N7522_011039 [Penicillium canescens]